MSKRLTRQKRTVFGVSVIGEELPVILVLHEDDIRTAQREAVQGLGNGGEDFLLPRDRFDEGEAEAGEQGVDLRHTSEAGDGASVEHALDGVGE